MAGASLHDPFASKMNDTTRESLPGGSNSSCGPNTLVTPPPEQVDSLGPIPGYFDAPWPAECGGPRRQKAPRARGLGIVPGTRLSQVSRHNGEWNVMVVQRAPGELFLQFNNHISSEEKYGGIERIDPETLQPTARSPRLPSGGHTWCGGVVAHANGYLYFNNGDRCFKLDPDCAVVASTKLPRDSAYNSLLVMADGRLVMKNIERDASRISALVVLDPERLELVGPEVPIPESSMGRIAMDTTSKGQYVYVPGSHSFFRYRYKGGLLDLDHTWAPRYRTRPDAEQSFAWDACLSGGGCWFLDNGDNEANAAIFARRPFGQTLPARGSAFRGLASSPQKLYRVALDDPSHITVLEPFGVPRGSIFSPPVFDPFREIAVAFDTGNGQLGAFRYTRQGFARLWARPCRISMQMVVFFDTGELIVNDFQNGFDQIAVFDIETGEEKGRAATEGRTANGMFLSPGWQRDVIYCSIGTLARVFVI